MRGTLRLSKVAMRSATGAKLSSGLNCPSVGRPKCEVTITAAPASRHICTAGIDARIRVSSVMLPASSWGTLRSARIRTRFPFKRPDWANSLKRLTLNNDSGMFFDKNKVVMVFWVDSREYSILNVSGRLPKGTQQRNTLPALQ